MVKAKFSLVYNSSIYWISLRPRLPSAYRALPCLAARSMSATRASATPHPVHPAQPPAAQPPFAGPPPWSWQSQVPRRTRRRTASTASTAITRPMMTVAGLISNGSTSRLLSTAPLSGALLFAQMIREKYPHALASERTERRAQDAPAVRFLREPYATPCSASACGAPPLSLYSGRGRNSWNSMPTSTTTATAVHTLNSPPPSSMPNW